MDDNNKSNNYSINQDHQYLDLAYSSTAELGNIYLHPMERNSDIIRKTK